MENTSNPNKAKFISLLESTNRNGIRQLIENLEKCGFFEAPASTRFHGNYPGGLVEHSLYVYQQAMYLKKVETHIKPKLTERLPDNSIIIASLLHDVCKADFYYLTKKWRKDANNKWEQYDGYEKDFKKLPVGHGEKSVIRLLQWGFELTDDEICAIRWHMSGFDVSNYQDALRSLDSAAEIPLVAIIVAADYLASHISEVKSEVKTEEKKDK